MMLTHTRAIVWAQWRTLRNFYPRMGAGWTALVGLIWYGFWIVVAVAVSLLIARPANPVVIGTILPATLLLVFLYWQLVPLLMAASGASLDLRKLQVYPIPVAQLFGVEVLLRVTAALEVFLVLAGMAVGVIRNPSLHGWGSLALIPFIAFNLLLGVGLRDAITRILARRRIREAAFFLLILCAALPQILITRSGNFPDRIAQVIANQALFRQTGIGWPWTAAAHILQGQDVLYSTALLAGWCSAAGAFGYWQFMRTLAFDAQAASARPSGPGTQGGLTDRLFRLPSVLLADPLGALVEKEVRFLARSPRFRMVFLMGFTFGLLVWLPVAFGRQENSQSFLRSNYLTAISVYSLLLLSEACFWNSFGFDRSAAQIYFLAPVSFSRVLIGKNLTALIFITLEIGTIAVVCGLLGMPMTPAGLGEAFAVASVISIFLLSAGNQLSVRQPRGVNPASSFRTGTANRVQAILFVIYPVAFLPVGLAYLARYALDSQAAFFDVLAFDAVIGLIVYKIALDSAVEAAERLKEKIVGALSRGDGPIAA
jgi:ABC-2 type transport system permease protein